MHKESIKVKNHKCFKDTFEGFERILPINIIIGKNNSGKSSLIDIIQSICLGKSSSAEIYCEYRPTYSQFVKDLAETYGGNRDEIFMNNLYRQAVQNKTLYYRYDHSYSTPCFRFVEDKKVNHISDNFEGYNLWSVFSKVQFPGFKNYSFRRLNAERDIKVEESKFDISVTPSGEGVTNIIQQFLNRKDLQKHKVVRNNFLEAINTIVNPEIEFKEIAVQVSNKDSYWEICFEDKFGNNIFLSQMGSGIKTIIQVLVNLILIPILDNAPMNNYIFCFEELENNLHPSLQRRLYQFIKQFAQINKCTFFITTHSNIGIDIFYSSDSSQLIAVNNTNGISTCKTIIQNDHLNDLLYHLGFKASDLLQTNGIIWVEGPSDRIYIKHWISLININLHEGVHYSIMYYGGKLLSHLTFKDKNFEEFILLLRINKNAFVVIDKDAKRNTDDINTTKQRIQSEIGQESCWVTSGREIENYISESSIRQWMNNKSNFNHQNLYFGKFDKLENVVHFLTPQYNKNKNGYSKEIIKFINNDDLNTYDLKDKIQGIVNVIEKWNS